MYNWDVAPLLSYDVECVSSSDSQYYYLQKKLQTSMQKKEFQLELGQ